MNPVSEVVGYILAHEALLYPLIALVIMIQGEIAILTSLYLIRLGHLAWSWFIIIALVAIVIEETAIFLAGALLGKTTFGKKLITKVPFNQKIHAFLHGNIFHSLCVAKFMWISRLIVFWFGHSGLNTRKFLKNDIPSVIIWLATITAICYVLLSVFGAVDEETALHRIELSLPVLLIVIFLIELLIRRLFRKRAPILEANTEDDAHTQNLPSKEVRSE